VDPDPNEIHRLFLAESGDSKTRRAMEDGDESKVPEAQLLFSAFSTFTMRIQLTVRDATRVKVKDRATIILMPRDLAISMKNGALTINW
jgi:hypothetical protein